MKKKIANQFNILNDKVDNIEKILSIIQIELQKKPKKKPKKKENKDHIVWQVDSSGNIGVFPIQEPKQKERVTIKQFILDNPSFQEKTKNFLFNLNNLNNSGFLYVDQIRLDDLKCNLGAGQLNLVRDALYFYHDITIN